MAAKAYSTEITVGTTVAFKTTASTWLANLPAKVSQIIARLHNGDYLVSLEYDQPVKFRDEHVVRIDALASDLQWYPSQA